MKPKTLNLILLNVLLTIQLLAQNETNRFYIGTNPLAYAMEFQLKEEIKRYAPIVTGNEYGINLVAGYVLKPRWNLEARFSTGKVHQVSSVAQVHGGVNWYFPKRDFYLGTFLKYWDYHNKLTDVDFSNVSPYLVAGYRYKKENLFIDIRINQTVAIYSWTDIDNTSPGIDWYLSPWPEFIPVIPTLTLTIGYIK